MAESFVADLLRCRTAVTNFNTTLPLCAIIRARSVRQTFASALRRVVLYLPHLVDGAMNHA